MQFLIDMFVISLPIYTQEKKYWAMILLVKNCAAPSCIIY